ncbi:hypothetical protein WR25_09785 isoform N [Diploscapter pachys]|nr:hypothetical protein WR25_09785 isoform I [Diploscapter pachys]PAV72925.1 hypothetical protein WR25_09785 isoform N [Diploscapter pachys]
MDERVDPLDDERIRDHCDDNCLCIVLYYTMAFAASRLLPNTELVRDDHTANLASLYTEYTNGDMSSYTSFAYMGGISAMLNDLAGLLNALPARTLFHLVSHCSYFLAERLRILISSVFFFVTTLRGFLANIPVDYEYYLFELFCEDKISTKKISDFLSLFINLNLRNRLLNCEDLPTLLTKITYFELKTPLILQTYDSSMSEVLGSLLLDQLTVKFKQYKLVCNGMKDSPISQMNQLFNCRALSGANRMIEPGKIRVVMTYHGSADANFAIHPFVSKAKSVAITLHKMIPLPWLLRMECPELDLWMHRDVPTIPWITPVESCYGFLHIVGIILELKTVRELTHWAVPVNASFCLCLVMLQPKTFGDVTYVWKREFKHPRYAFIEREGIHGWLLYRDERNVKNRLLVFQLSNPSMVYFEALSSTDAATLLTPISFYHHSHRY